MPVGRPARRNGAAPQPAEAPRRTRGTRGESHDVSDVELSTNRRNARASSAESRAARGGRSGRGGRQGTRARPMHDVPTVAEEDSSIEAPTNDGRAARSPGGVSAISGTTARNSYNAHELADLDSDGMIGALPDLSHISDRTLDLLAPHQISDETFSKICEDLHDSNSWPSKNFQKYRGELDSQKAKFGNGPWIDVLRALMGILKVKHTAELSGGLWRPDDIFYKANLATAVEDLYERIAVGTVDLLPLEKFDRDFPEPFLKRLVVGTGNPMYETSSLFKDTFALALDLRTQFVLKVFKANAGEPNFDADKVLHEVFLDKDNPNSSRGWDVEGMRKEELKKAQNKAISDRMKEISERFDQQDNTVDIEGLYQAFPATNFALKFLTWARMRADEIERSLAAVGNVSGIQGGVEGELARRTAIAAGNYVAGQEIQLNYQPPNVSGSEASKAVDFNLANEPSLAIPENIKLLKNMRRAHGARASSANSAKAQAAIKRISNPAPTAPMSTGHYAHEMPIDPQLTGGAPVTEQQRELQEEDIMMARVLTNHSQNKADFNKENDPQAAALVATTLQQRQQRSFLDPQPGATRVSFDDTQQDTRLDNGALEGGDDESEDGGFATAPRPVTTGRKRKAPGDSTNTSAKRRQIGSSAAGSSAGTGMFQASEPLSASLDHIPEDVRPYYAAKEQNKVETARIRAQKPPQRRKAWSIEETGRLQYYIETLGISWSAIKKADDTSGSQQFVTRDQVALKDKARNMKFDMLKAHATLPTNFDLVPLKKTQREELKRFGVDLDAAEAHYDAEQQTQEANNQLAMTNDSLARS